MHIYFVNDGLIMTDCRGARLSNLIALKASRSPIINLTWVTTLIVALGVTAIRLLAVSRRVEDDWKGKLTLRSKSDRPSENVTEPRETERDRVRSGEE